VVTGGEVVMVWGGRRPVFSIGYDRDAGRSGLDSGYTILFDDAPDPGDVSVADRRIRWMHLGCVVEEYPEIGRGLDLAREFGAADLDDAGEWVGRKLANDD
jgi:hypothetical protein